MSTTLTIAFYGPNPGCPPTSCYQAGSPVALELTDTAAPKSADGAGWLVGVLSEDAKPQAQVGATDWVYVINFPDTEFSSEYLEGQLPTLTTADVNSGDNAIGLCCLTCGTLMILDRLMQLESRSINRESFRVFEHNIPHQTGLIRLFRNHSTILIHAIEASVEEHLAGYPYAEEPGKETLTFLATAAQQTGPFNAVTALELEIDPSSAEPLTARLEFVPPLEIPGGAAFGSNLDVNDPEAHLGLEIHIDFQVSET